MLSGVVAEGDVAKESIIIEKESCLEAMEFQGYNVTLDVKVEEMHMGMFDSHNVKCGDFVIGESLSRYWTCMECHMSNISYLIVKFLLAILWYVFFPKELVALKLELPSFRYVTSTINTCSRLSLGLVKYP